MRKIIILSIIIIMSFSLFGCSTTQKIMPHSDKSLSALNNKDTLAKKEIIVAAASSLTNAFTEIGSAFEKKYNCAVTFSVGSTATLSEQIVNGAPFDVFAAADEIAIDNLDENELIISNTKRLYALGRLGIATLKNSDIEVKNIEDLLRPEVKIIAIANPEHAPYGLAAKQAIETAGLWEELHPKMVYAKNISEALTFITTGNADAGFIALSLNDEDSLSFNLVDDKMHEPLRQAMAVIKNTKETELAHKFVEYVNSEEGTAIMSRFGFVTPKE